MIKMNKQSLLTVQRGQGSIPIQNTFLKTLLYQVLNELYNVSYVRLTHHSPDKVQVFGHHVIEVIGDEDSTDKQLDEVVLLGSVLVEHAPGGGSRDKQDGLEGDLTLGCEVDVGEGLICVLEGRLKNQYNSNTNQMY